MDVQNKILPSQINSCLFLLLSYIYLLFYSRIAVNYGLPSLFNHFHLIYIYLVFIFFFIQKILSKKNILNPLLFFILLYLFSVIISTFLNFVNFDNIIIYIFINIEIFIYLILVTSLELDKKQLKIFRYNIIFIGLLNCLMAYYQSIVLNLDEDSVKGIFIGLGNGAHLSGAISSLLAFYFLVNEDIKFKIKIFLILILYGCNIITDSKQILLVFFLISGIYILFNKKKYSFLKSVTFFFLICSFIYYLTTMTFFKNLLENDFFTIKEMLRLKFNVFNLIFYNFYNFIDYLFGLGPGQVSSRLAYLSPEYENIKFLNLKTNTLTIEIWNVQQSNYLTNYLTGSSLASLFFHLSSSIGEIGFVGYSLYLLICYKIVRYLKYELSIFLLILSLLIFGVLYHYPEEPGFTIYLASIISLRFHENRLNNYDSL